MMKYADDYAIGQTYDLGSHQITAEEIIEFASKYDPQDYHLNEEAGAKSFFGGLVASGWNAASIWMKLYVTGMLGDAAVEGSPGVDELRWLSPVRPGDILHGKVEIVGRVPSLFDPDVVTLRKKGSLYRNGSDQPVCTLILNSRYKTRTKLSQDSIIDGA